MPYEKEFANHITNQKVLKEDSFIEDLKSLGLRLKAKKLIKNNSK